MNKLISDVMDLVNENERLQEELKYQRENTILVDKFYNVGLTTDVVAALHSVSAALVRKYIKEGLIETHPQSTDAKILVRASDALTLDFKAMKKQLIINQINR